VVGGSFNDTATRPYISQDIRFTTKGDLLYAIALGCPADGHLVIRSLAEGSAELPAQKTREYAWAFRITHFSH
jgi:alpha-L-fucosidase